MDNIRLVLVPAGFYWKFYRSLFMEYIELCAVNLFMTFGNSVLWIAGRSLLLWAAVISRIMLCCLPVPDPLVHSCLFSTNICCSTTRVYAIFPTAYLYFSIIKHCIKFVTICGQFNITNMAAGRHLGFFETEIITNRSAISENPTLEPNITLIRRAVAKLWPFLFIQDGR